MFRFVPNWFLNFKKILTRPWIFSFVSNRSLNYSTFFKIHKPIEHKQKLNDHWSIRSNLILCIIDFLFFIFLNVECVKDLLMSDTNLKVHDLFDIFKVKASINVWCWNLEENGAFSTKPPTDSLSTKGDLSFKNPYHSIILKSWSSSIGNWATVTRTHRISYRNGRPGSPCLQTVALYVNLPRKPKPNFL